MARKPERIVVRPGYSSGTGRTVVLWLNRPSGPVWKLKVDQLAEIDATSGSSVLVHLMSDLMFSHAGWKRKPNLEEAVAYVIRQHEKHGSLKADVPVEWEL